MVISLSILLRLGDFSYKIIEKIKTHILYSVTFFPKVVLFFEIMRKNMLRASQGTYDNIILRMCFACRVGKAECRQALIVLKI